MSALSPDTTCPFSAQTLQFQTVKHDNIMMACQPTNNNTNICVFVTGNLYVDGSQNPLLFAQTFVLAPAGGSWFVANDLFRLVTAA